MGISDLLAADGVVFDADPPNKAGLLELLATEAAERTGCSRKDILDALQAREQIGSTALGKGVALPHTELDGATAPLALFVRLARPIDFDARDDEPVDLVFMVLWPTANRKGLLPVMSEICQALRDPQSQRRLRTADSPEAVVDFMRQATASAPGTGAPPDD